MAWRDQNRRQRRENMNKSARCAPRLSAREAAELVTYSGDSTSVDAVARLRAPGLANLVFTDPV